MSSESSQGGAAFLKELNEAIAPMLAASKYREDGTFTVRAAPCEYLESALLVVNGRFTALVKTLGVKHFGIEPRFNNSETTWWF